MTSIELCRRTYCMSSRRPRWNWLIGVVVALVITSLPYLFGEVPF